MSIPQLRPTRPGLILGLLALGTVALLVPTVSADCNCFNVIRNPSFEGGASPITGYPTGWGNWTKHGGSDYSMTVDNTTAVDQFHSARLEIGQLPIGFIALVQDLPPNTFFSNLTDRADGIDFWFKLEPKYSGMGDFRVRILYGENVAELNYVVDADRQLYYPNSTFLFEDGRTGGVKSILIGNSTLDRQGSWFHFKRNLKADWTAPLKIRQPDGSTVTAPGFSLDIPFPRIQFDILAFQHALTGQYFAEIAWVEAVKVWLDLPAPTPPLVANFVFAPTLPEAGNQVSFTATASGGTGPYTYSWDFGDTSQPGSGNQVSHVYSAAGNFVVMLTVADSSLSTSTVTHAVTVAPPRYSLVFNFEDQNGGPVDDAVKWKLLNATDQTIIGYTLGEKTLVAGLYTIEAYYPTYTNQLPEPYMIFRKTVALNGNLSLVFSLAMVPENSQGDYIAFKNNITSAQVLSQNSTNLVFNATGTPGTQYEILVKLRFRPQAVIRTGSQRVLLPETDWSFDPANMILKISTSELGKFALSAGPAPHIPIITFVDRTGQRLEGVVALRISNSRGDTVSSQLQGQISQDENFPYFIEAYYRGYLVYKSTLTFSSSNPVPQQIIQLEMIRLGLETDSYLVVNRTITSITTIEHSSQKISFAIQGTGPALIVLDVPKRPLYVESNGARTASWTYDAATNSIAIEADAQGTFTIVFEQPQNYTNYVLAGGALATVGATSLGLIRWKRKSSSNKPVNTSRA